MEDQQKVELFDKAFFIVKNSGKKDGIYYHLDKNGLDIFYSEYADLLTVYYHLETHPDPVLQAKDGKIFNIIDIPESSSWIDVINKEFRALIVKKPTYRG
jgi:hypothetical protein